MSVKSFGKSPLRFSTLASVFVFFFQECEIILPVRSSIVEEGLSYRFHASWPFVLQILGCFYRTAGRQAHPIMVKVKLVLTVFLVDALRLPLVERRSPCPAQSLQSLADLRSTPHFPFSGEVDLAVGAAVDSMGPEVVLGAVPLNITGVE